MQFQSQFQCYFKCNFDVVHRPVQPPQNAFLSVRSAALSSDSPKKQKVGTVVKQSIESFREDLEEQKQDLKNQLLKDKEIGHSAKSHLH